LTTAAELKVTAEFQSPEESERDRESANKDPVQMLGAEMAQQQAMMLAMMQKIEGMTKEVDHLKQHTNRGSPHNSEGRRSPHSSDSECNLSLTSSLQDTLQRARGQRGPDSFRMQGSPVEGHTFASTQPAKGKELDEVKGIPAYPTTAEFAGWKRETRYAVAAASVQPEVALHHVMQAEKWTGDILSLPRRAEFQTLEVKFGKALKSTLRGDVRREVANLEERVLREQGRLLNGTEIYSWIVRQFKRDLKLARPQVLKEISLVKLGAGRNALRNFKAKWDAAVERLVDIGSSKESDQEILYMYFKDQFMQSNDMTDSVAKVNRSPASSSVHSYQWMYQAVEARLETMRLHTQEVERVAAYKVDSPSPMTPGVETVKGQGKSNPNRDTSKEACKRMLKEGKCEFEGRCWFSHDKAVLDTARKKGKGKIMCKHFAAGKCLKGDRCDFSHEIPEQNGAGDMALGTVAISAVAHPIEPEIGSKLIQGSSGSVAETAAPGTRKLSEEQCAEYVLSAHAADNNSFKEIDEDMAELLKVIEEESILAKQLERDVEEYQRNERGSVAETAPAGAKGTLQLPAEVREWLDVPTKMRGKSKSKKKKKK